MCCCLTLSFVCTRDCIPEICLFCLFLYHTHTHTHTTLYLVSNVFFTEKDYAQAHEMNCSPVQEVDDLQGSLCVCVCMIATHTTLLRSKWNVFPPSLPPQKLGTRTDYIQYTISPCPSSFFIAKIFSCVLCHFITVTHTQETDY